MRRIRTLRDESGQALTEFAVVMPLLFILIFAIVEAGLTLNNYLRLTDAVRVSARVASVQGSEGAASATSAATAALADAAGNLQVKSLSVSATAWQSGKPITVQASTQYAINLPLFGTVLSGTLTSRSTQRIE